MRLHLTQLRQIPADGLGHEMPQGDNRSQDGRAQMPRREQAADGSGNPGGPVDAGKELPPGQAQG